MTWHYIIKGRVTLSMYEYIDKMHTELQSDMNGASKVPASGHLYYILPDMTKLPENKAELFYQLVAKLLYLFRQPGRTFKLQSHSYVLG